MGDASAKPSPRLLILTGVGTLLALLVISLLLTFFVHRLRDTADWVRHTQEVVLQAFRVEKLALDMESGVRGFQISRDVQFLEHYNEADAVIRAEIAKLQELVKDNPHQSERGIHIQQAFAHWSQFAAEVLQRTKAGQAVNDVAMNTRGKGLMDDIRQEIGWFLEQEDLLDDLRRRDLLQLKRNAALCRTGLLLIAALGLAWMLIVWLRPRFRPPDMSAHVPESSNV